jgi:hypothetical protein
MIDALLAVLPILHELTGLILAIAVLVGATKSLVRAIREILAIMR